MPGPLQTGNRTNWHFDTNLGAKSVAQAALGADNTPRHSCDRSAESPTILTRRDKRTGCASIAGLAGTERQKRARTRMQSTRERHRKLWMARAPEAMTRKIERLLWLKHQL